MQSLLKMLIGGNPVLPARMTPVMAANVTDRIWTVADVRLAE